MFTGDISAPDFIFDELPVTVYMDENLSFDIDVMLLGKDSMYVNVEELFKKLIIPCEVSNNGNRLAGFIENEKRPYVIEFDAKEIKIGNTTLYPGQGLVKEMGSLYIESKLLAHAFGITMTINRRSLDAKLQSAFELPVVRQMRIENTRKKISKLRNEQIIADTLVKRNYHLFKFGTLDWSAASYQTWNEKTNNRFGLGIGTELLYGEANISAYYDDQYNFDKRQVNYLWRWIDNDKNLIKQAEAGKISTQSIAFLQSPVVGASIKNTPNTLRKASGFYPVNGVTEPNWTVELYINDILVEYLKADASGLYLFNVPIVYGNTVLKLKFYGPLGEERTEERTINNPYTILPAKETEYSLSAGVLQDNASSRFAKGELNYGLSRTFTLGTGVEYLSSIVTGTYIPYIKGTFQPFSRLTVNGEYAYGVRARGLLSYYFGKNTLLELDYAKYAEGQKATLSNAPEERKIRLSVPIKVKMLNGYARLEYRQFVYPEFTFNYGSAVLSAFYKQFSANSTTTLNWTNNDNTHITSDMALSFRFSKAFVFRPSLSYNVSDKTFLHLKAEVEKRFRSGYFNVGYEKNILYNQDYITVGLKYDLPFARTNFSVSKNQGKMITSESAQGSIAIGGSNYTHLSNNSSLSKGGILLYPFLDVNLNGVFDTGEPIVKVNFVNISGGKPIFSEKDSIIRIPDLNGFTNYILEFKDDDLEAISWRFTNKIYSVLVDPNQFKRVDVPVISVGEVSGITYLNKNDGMKGLGRIILKFYDKSTHLEVAQTLSESDGYVYYLGLKPGEYIACVDSAQLINLGFTVDPPCREFTIKTILEGDMVGGLDFILRPANEDPMPGRDIKEEAIIGSPVNVDSQSLLKVSVQKVEEKNTKSEDFQYVVHAADTINQTVKPDSENISKEKESIAPEGGKITLPASMHRIDQKTSANKVLKEFMPGDTLYKVQLLALPKPLTNKNYFKKLVADVPGLIIEETLGEDGLYHYSTPAASGISESRELQRIIRKSGWKDSFIAKYAGEKRTEAAFRRKLDKSERVSVKNVSGDQSSNSNKNKAVSETTKVEPMIEMKKEINLDPAGPYSALLHGKIALMESDASFNLPGDTLYKVQLLALSKSIQIDSYFALLLSKMPGLKITEVQGEDGIFRYSTESFRSHEEAFKFNQVIRQSGWVDSFITTYFIIEKRN